jgi:hypothetical protein
LFHETNTGKSDDSDGYVEAVFRTEAKAERAKLALIRLAIKAGAAVYWNPDTEEETLYWEHDWRVEFHPFETNARKAARQGAEVYGWVRARKAAK